MTENVRQTAHEPLCRPIVAEHEQDTASDGAGLQNGPEGTMESLAGLRVYVGRHARMDEMTKAALLVYAREIEREVKELTDERDLLKTQWEAGVDFDQRLEACADKRADVTLFGVDYTALPLDADGVPIHVGETVTCILPFGGESEPFVVDRMELGRDGDGDVWSVALDRPTSCWEQPLLLRHHHAPTVEDVLREFAVNIADVLGGDDFKLDDNDELYAEFAARLRLAGDAE